MRLLCTINPDQNNENPYIFSNFLKKRNIDNECEEVNNPGEPPFFRIWIVEEEKVEKARALYQKYQKNPQEYHEDTPQQETEKEESRKKSSYGPLSIIIIGACLFIFLASALKKETAMPPPLPGIVEAPLLSKIDRNLLFDYPLYFEKRDQLLKIYTPQDIKEKKPPNEEAKSLIEEIKETPFWRGVYDLFVQSILSKKRFDFQGPMFEKISQGEIWRIFSPALVHFNLLHIFFNLLWFIMLGNQIEKRVGSFKYLILILLTASISNVLQYLMSGSFFMGLSGVVVGLVGFIWARQKRAPWEGYLLNRMTLIFLGAFVFGMFFLQLLFFTLQIMGKFNLNIAIANTAHIAGGVTGYLLGSLKLFAFSPSKRRREGAQE